MLSVVSFLELFLAKNKCTNNPLIKSTTKNNPEHGHLLNYFYSCCSEARSLESPPITSSTGESSFLPSSFPPPRARRARRAGRRPPAGPFVLHREEGGSEGRLEDLASQGPETGGKRWSRPASARPPPRLPAPLKTQGPNLEHRMFPGQRPPRVCGVPEVPDSAILG